MLRLGRSVFKDLHSRFIAIILCTHVTMSIYFAIVSFDFPEPDSNATIIAVMLFSIAFVATGILYIFVDRILPNKLLNKVRQSTK